MNTREEFEKLAVLGDLDITSNPVYGDYLYDSNETNLVYTGWLMRQSEVNKLTEEINNLKERTDSDQSLPEDELDRGEVPWI